MSDDEGTTGSVAKSISIASAVGDHWALIVQSYTDELGYSDIEGMLRSHGWTADHINNLYGRRLSGSEVENGFGWLRNKVRSGDKVLVWLSTHGANPF